MNTKCISVDIYIYVSKYDLSGIVMHCLNRVLRFTSFNIGYDIIFIPPALFNRCNKWNCPVNQYCTWFDKTRYALLHFIRSDFIENAV